MFSRRVYIFIVDCLVVLAGLLIAAPFFLVLLAPFIGRL